MPAFSSRHTSQFLDVGGASVTGAAALTATSSLTVAGVRTRSGAAALIGTSSLTVAGTVLRIGAAALTGSSSLVVSGTNSATGSCTLSGVSSLTCAAGAPPPPTPTGGFVRVKPRTGPLLPTTKLTPAPARVCVTAFAPTLILGISAPIVRMAGRSSAPMSTITFDAGVVSSHTLGELPRSKRDLIDLLVIHDR